MTTTPAVRRHPLRNVVTARYVPRLLSAALVGRLPTGMASLAVLLVVRDRGADYALAGLLAGTFAVGQALGGPVLARLVDRFRQAPVLVGGAVVSSLGFLLFAAVDVRAYPLVAALGVLVAGLAIPPLEPCLRVLWSDVLPPEDVHAAYSLDVAAQELIFTAGPLVVLGVVALAGPPAGIVAAAVLGTAGTLVFATARPSREWRGVAADRHWAGPLRSRPLVRMITAVAFVGMTLGVFIVAITAHAEDVATRSASAWLLAANAFGALVGGIVNALAPASRDPSRRLLVLALAMAVLYAPLVVAPGLPGTLVLTALAGLPLPPVLSCAMLLTDRLAPAGTVTESFAWIITAFGVGSALGSALAGAAVDAAGYPYAMALAVLSSVVAAAVVARRLVAVA